MTDKRPHVVIIGGGFGGLAAARKLARTPVDITLLDRRNHHLFQPLLYQVATAGLNPSDIAYPIRAIVRKQKNVRVLLADARGIEVERKRVILDRGELSYDYLIVATGATHSYFGNDDWIAHAPGLKTVEDALDIRRRILLAYEAAERETDPAARRAYLTFAVVGAGPTGVELAGALAELGKYTLARDFRHVDPTQVEVVLVEAAPRVLPPYPDELSEKARAHLQKLGVTVRTGERVTDIDDGGLTIGDERIAARTVLWAAGVQASPLATSLGAPLDRAGRVEVSADLTIPGHPEVFVVGDLAAATDPTGAAVPGVAPAAVQGGEHAALSIHNELAGRPAPVFRYRDKGSMATIGRAAAVVQLGRLRFAGISAWVVWWLIHILFLIGFRNRFLVMFAWAWSYLTYQRGARLITGEHDPLPDLGEPAEPAARQPPAATHPVSLPAPQQGPAAAARPEEALRAGSPRG